MEAICKNCKNSVIQNYLDGCVTDVFCSKHKTNFTAQSSCDEYSPESLLKHFTSKNNPI